MSHYRAENYTIEILDTAELNVMPRQSGEAVETINLNEGKCNIWADDTDFYLIGTQDEIDGAVKFSETGLKGNEVAISTHLELTGIGEASPFEINGYTVQIRLVVDTLEFYKK